MRVLPVGSDRRVGPRMKSTTRLMNRNPARTPTETARAECTSSLRNCSSNSRTETLSSSPSKICAPRVPFDGDFGKGTKAIVERYHTGAFDAEGRVCTQPRERRRVLLTAGRRAPDLEPNRGRHPVQAVIEVPVRTDEPVAHAKVQPHARRDVHQKAGLGFCDEDAVLCPDVHRCRDKLATARRRTDRRQIRVTLRQRRPSTADETPCRKPQSPL